MGLRSSRTSESEGCVGVRITRNGGSSPSCSRFIELIKGNNAQKIAYIGLVQLEKAVLDRRLVEMV